MQNVVKRDTKKMSAGRVKPKKNILYLLTLIRCIYGQLLCNHPHRCLILTYSLLSVTRKRCFKISRQMMKRMVQNLQTISLLNYKQLDLTQQKQKIEPTIQVTIYAQYIASTFSRNSEALSSKFLENLKNAFFKNAFFL